LVEEDLVTTTINVRTGLLGRYSIAAFFILAMVLGAVSVYLVVQGVLPSGVALAASLSASIAGIIMTAVEDGIAGLKLMLNRLLIWKVGIGYWLFAIFYLVLALFLGSVANPAFNGDPLSLKDFEPAFNIVPMFIVFFVVAGLGQELGWTGFLIPRLQSRYSALTSSLLRAILIGVWYIPLFFYSRLDLSSLADFPYSGWIAQKGFLVAFGVLILLFVLPWSIFFSWIFNNTRGSLLLVSLLHGTEIGVAYWMLSTGIDPRNLDNYWGYGFVMLMVAIIIVIATGSQNLSRTAARIAQPTPLGKV
jgi:membrane protease YdiL (CAAX protease family)